MDSTVAPLASIGVDIGKEVFHLVGTYQRLPLSTHELTCDQQPVHTFGPNAVIPCFCERRASCPLDTMKATRELVWNESAHAKFEMAH
jgi:hypothetical protein